MNLIRLTFRLAAGGSERRLATSNQDVDAIEARFLTTIPGAVFCLRTTLERDIEPGRAAWVYQAQALAWLANACRKNDRPASHYRKTVQLP